MSPHGYDSDVITKRATPSLFARFEEEQLFERSRPEGFVIRLLQQLWSDEQGQDIAEYAVMLAVILVIVVGTIRLIGSNANNVFSSVGSAIQ